MTTTTHAPIAHPTESDAVEAVQALNIFEKGGTDIGAWTRTVDNYVPNARGVAALAKASGIAKATVSRYAAAGCLLNTIDTLPGKATLPAKTALKAGREADKGGVTGPVVRRMCKEATTAKGLVDAINAAMDKKTADHDAAKANARKGARPNDGTEGEQASEQGPADTLAPDAEILADIRAVARKLAALRKAGAFDPGNVDRGLWAKVADSADTVARHARAIVDADDTAAKASVTPADVAKAKAKA